MDITKFDFEGQKVRIITGNNGQPWWVAKDVCTVLELSNPSEAIRSLDEDERNTLRISEGIQRGNPTVNVINEPGLYTLIIRSNKPEAKKFKRWITHEVLPSIRETGAYVQPGATDLIPSPFKIAGLRPNQRLKAMEMAWRMTQMDIADRQTMLDYYATLCETVAGPLNQTRTSGFTEFLETHCMLDPDGMTAKRELYDAYCEFMSDTGRLRVSREVFFKKIFRNKKLSTTRPRMNGKRVGYVKGLTMVK